MHRTLLNSGRGLRTVTGRGHGLFHDANFVRCQAVESIDKPVNLALQRGRVGGGISLFGRDYLLHDLDDEALICV